MNMSPLSRLNEEGLILLGCGKMGSALLQGWLSAGVRPSAITVLDPNPSKWLLELQKKGLGINTEIEPSAVCVLAVKPQIISAATSLKSIAESDTVFLSIAAGTTLDVLTEILGQRSRIVRSMPNTPAAIGQGVTALVGNIGCTSTDIELTEAMLGTVGQTVLLESESQMDAVTGVSGSGPAYVFHLVECLAAAGQSEGLSADVAMKLALATVSGAGALAQNSSENVSQLRQNVTSPAGTTEAGLDVLMSNETGLLPLIGATVRAAIERSKELGKR